jgi:hypothetical protein
MSDNPKNGMRKPLGQILADVQKHTGTGSAVFFHLISRNQTRPCVLKACPREVVGNAVLLEGHLPLSLSLIRGVSFCPTL